MYICFQKAKEQFDCNGKSLGMGEDLAIYYDKRIGRRRNYRQTYPNLPDLPMYRGLKLKTFKNKKNAQKLCDYINQNFGNNFEVIEIYKEN